MSKKQTNCSSDTCHLHLPGPSQSRCSAKSHSSSCLSSQYENQYFEGGGVKGPLWFTKDNHHEFSRLITTPPKNQDPTKTQRRKRRKKKSFGIEVVGGGKSVKRTHKCHRVGGCKRQRLHSEDSSNKRSSADLEQSKRARLAVLVVALSLIMLSFFLVGLTLRMAPIIDELVRKGNEEIYRSMSAGASTSSPPTEGAAVGNNTTPSSSAPG